MIARVPATVAILDIGIDPARFEPDRLVPGIDLTAEGEASDRADPHGHGTAMAGTVIASSGARVMPVRIICERGYLREDSLIETAFEWILKRGVAELRVDRALRQRQAHVEVSERVARRDSGHG